MQSSKELIESGHRVVDSFRDERCGEKEREKEERSGGGQTTTVNKPSTHENATEAKPSPARELK